MFNEHGEFTVARQGNILLVHIIGAWNVETAKAYKQTFNKTIETIKDEAWALISNVEQWELCTPDCEILIVQLGVESRDKGLKREAVVNTNTESVKLDLFHKHIKKDTTEISPHVFQRCFFKTDIEANQWLKNEGYGLK